jgi:DNA polymerase-4
MGNTFMSTFSSPQNFKYLFIDMNSYFASCEQEANPSYRNKPIAVTPVNTANGCIVSASYEAKAYGVKTGTLVRDAKKICPGIIIKESNTYLYLDYHKKWTKILSNFSPFISIKSIDEAALKLSPSERNSGFAHALALKIKNVIESRVGRYLKSSIGIGPNVFLAKQGSDFQKPNGLFEIKIENISEYYSSIKLTDIKGINIRMERRLNTLGFFTPLDLFNATNETLKRKMGMIGEYWYLKLHGYDLPDAERILPKSIGHSHVLPPKFRSWKLAWSVCQKLIERAGFRLRSYGLQAEGVYLGIRFLTSADTLRYQQLNRPHGFRKHLKTQPFFDSHTFSSLIFKIWQEIPKADYLPLKIAVTMFNLKKPSFRQQKLFESFERQENLSFAMDLINDKYGAFTIKSANVLLAEDSAPNRISFGKPFDY